MTISHNVHLDSGILKLALLNSIQRRHIRQHNRNSEVFEQVGLGYATHCNKSSEHMFWLQ